MLQIQFQKKLKKLKLDFIRLAEEIEIQGIARKEEQIEKQLFRFQEELVKLRLELLRLIEEQEMVTADAVFSCENWKAELNEKYIKLSIPDVLSGLEIKSEKDRWIRKINKTLKTIQNLPKLEKIHVLIIIFRPTTNWDTDNYVEKTILDGIRRSGIIKDDTIEHVLGYTIVGKYSEEPRTEIYIFDTKNLKHFIQYIP